MKYLTLMDLVIESLMIDVTSCWYSDDVLSSWCTVDVVGPDMFCTYFSVIQMLGRLFVTAR